MEHKNLKTSVFSVETAFNDSAELPIDIDFTLPDYYADVLKILKCRAVSRVSSKNIKGNNISVEGCIAVTVIYCGNDNCISSYEYQYPFSKVFDTGINAEGTVLTVKSKCEYINCRAVTGRKIDIHGAAGIYVTLTRRKTTDVISDFDDGNIELLRESVPATIPMGCADKYLIVEEEIELGSAQPDIRCVIRYDAEATITDNKILAGKSVVKGEMLLKILYASENEASPQKVRCQIPFSQLIEIDGLTDGCDCDSKVSIAHLEIKPRVSATGECRQFLLNAKLLITSECCCNNDVAVILDAYSRKYEAEICKKEVCFDKICDNINQTFNCKKNIEFSDGVVSSISDIWCEAQVDSVNFLQGSMKIVGVVTAFVIAYDDSKVPKFYEKTIDFDYSYPIDTYYKCKCNPQIAVTDINYTLTSENCMELRIDINVCGAIYKCSNLPIVTDISIDTNTPLSKSDRGAMTIYYAAKGENIWDIARQYYASKCEIKQINDLEDDVLSFDKMILIPIN